MAEILRNTQLFEDLREATKASPNLPILRQLNQMSPYHELEVLTLLLLHLPADIRKISGIPDLQYSEWKDESVVLSACFGPV